MSAGVVAWTFRPAAPPVVVVTPEKPAKVLTLLEGLRNTHKNEWECETGIAYIVSGPRDWRVRRMTNGSVP